MQNKPLVPILIRGRVALAFRGSFPFSVAVSPAWGRNGTPSTFGRKSMDTLFQIVAVVVGVVAYALVAGWFDARRLREVARERAGDSICTFARALDYRRIDTKVIRAAYEAGQDYFAYLGRPFPLRPTDRFAEDFTMDDEDVDDLVIDAASRAGRSIENSEDNPFYDRVKSVGDMIEFLCCQPVSKKT